MPHTDKEWQDLWREFFGSIEGLVSERGAAGPTTRARNFAVAATSPLLGHIQRGASDAYFAIAQFQDPNHPYLEDTLFDELAAIAATNRAASQTPSSVSVLDSAIDDSETGKGSIEDLIGKWLPDWLKRALKLLNQLLKLIKT
jgi:hypothetical protein